MTAAGRRRAAPRARRGPSVERLGEAGRAPLARGVERDRLRALPARRRRRLRRPPSACRWRSGRRRARPARSGSRRRPARRAARASSKAISPTVSVPVLSRQTTSTRARPSTAGSCCTSTLRRVSCTADRRKATDVSSTRPSGTRPTTPAAERMTTSRQPWSPTVRHCDQIAIGRATDDDPGDVGQQGVDRLLDLGAGARELPCVSSDPVDVGVGPDLARVVAARPGDDARAGHDVVALVVGDGVGLAGQVGLVELEPGARDERAVGGHLVTGAQLDEVVLHDLASSARRAPRRRARPAWSGR